MNEYTAIVFSISEGVKHESLSKPKFDKFSLEIIPPSTTRHDRLQSIPWSRRIKVPKNGVVRLKLLPTFDTLYGYKGNSEFYEVNLFHKSQSMALDKWYWHIPPPLYDRSTMLSVKSGKIKIPDYAYSIKEVSAENYEIKKEYILTPNLEDNEQVKVTYEAGYTLDDITTFPYGSISTDKRKYSSRFSRPWLLY